MLTIVLGAHPWVDEHQVQRDDLQIPTLQLVALELAKKESAVAVHIASQIYVCDRASCAVTERARAEVDGAARLLEGILHRCGIVTKLLVLARPKKVFVIAPRFEVFDVDVTNNIVLVVVSLPMSPCFHWFPPDFLRAINFASL